MLKLTGAKQQHIAHDVTCLLSFSVQMPCQSCFIEPKFLSLFLLLICSLLTKMSDLVNAYWFGVSQITSWKT